MAAIGANFNPNIFHKDNPIIIATNRASAILNPVRLRYNASGYPAGTVLARNTTDGLFERYDDGASSGLNTASCILFEGHPVEDFDGTGATGSCMAAGIFGGCTVFEDKLLGLDANAKTDLGAKTIIDATGVKTLKF